MTARVAERSVERLSSMFGVGQDADKAAQRYTRSMEVLQDWGRILGVGYQDISREYVNWAQGQFQANLSALSRFMQCRTPEQLTAAQNQLFGESIALALIANRRLAEISKEMTDRGAQKVTEVADHTQQAEDQAA